jgi:hypothetical protein
MSNKKLMLDSCVWDCPTAEEVYAVVAKLGGINSVCRITKKHRNTVSKWCNGSVNIDFANWSLIRDYELKTIIIGLSCSSYMEAVVFTDKDVALVEFLHDRLLDVYGENFNLDYMKNARELAKKIQETV